jgi:uncharacterized integral membrane protein
MSVTETPDGTPAETRVQRLSRHGHRLFLYIWTLAIVGALIILIALIAANTRRVQVNFVFGDAKTSLIWVIVISAIAGWLGGIATAALYRFRTRKPRRK